MSNKAIIFDLDGVIVDTAKYHYLAWRELALQLGFDFTEEQNEQLKGVNRVRSLEILLKLGNVQLEEEQKTKLLIEKNTQYLEYIAEMDHTEILPGIDDILHYLKLNKIPAASFISGAGMKLNWKNPCKPNTTKINPNNTRAPITANFM